MYNGLVTKNVEEYVTDMEKEYNLFKGTKMSLISIRDGLIQEIKQKYGLHKHLYVKTIIDSYGNRLGKTDEQIDAEIKLCLPEEKIDEMLQQQIDNIYEAFESLKGKGYWLNIPKRIKYNFHVKGIYEIVNLKNNKRYIGKSIAISERWGQHKKMLNDGIHHCSNLQKEWSEIGGDSFRFNIIEEIDYSASEDDLKFKERFWWENSIGEKYNDYVKMCDDQLYKTKLIEYKVKVGDLKPYIDEVKRNSLSDEVYNLGLDVQKYALEISNNNFIKNSDYNQLRKDLLNTIDKLEKFKMALVESTTV